MEIKHDKSYLHLWEGIQKTGFTRTMVGKICFEGNGDIKTITEIADYLEENYKMYQYKKDNGIKFKQEELFYWSNGRGAYFDVEVQCNYGMDRMEEITEEIIKHLEENYNDKDIYIRLQYTEKKDWNLINEYLKQDFDINNLEITKLKELYSLLYAAGNRFTEESKDKLININNSYINQYLDKKVLWNKNIKGTIKKVRNGDFGLFKPRATRTYFSIDLGKIWSLEVI